MVGTKRNADSWSRGVARRRGGLAAVFAAHVFVALALVPGAYASNALIGEFGKPFGTNKGQLSGPEGAKGVAVNQTGAGGVASGDVYVVDTENNRIQEFSAAGAFVRAWGIDVVASGPDDKGISAFEICLPADECKAGAESAAAGGLAQPIGVAVDQENGNVYVVDATENEFVSNSRVNVYSATGAFEGAFGWGVNASTPEAKLQFCTTATGCKKGTIGGGAGQIALPERSLPAIGSNNGHFFLPNAGKGPNPANARIDELAPELNGAKEVIGVTFVKAFGWDVVASGPDQSSEIQKIRVSATGGTYKLTFEGQQTGPIAYNAPPRKSEEGVGKPESLEKALNSLSSISTGSGSVTVAGGLGDENGKSPYSVRFNGGPLKGKNVEQLKAASGSLIGGKPASVATIETYSDGGAGLESCVAANGDACKTATTGGRMGQFSSGNPTSLAVDSGGAVYAVNQNTDSIECGSDPLGGPCRVYKFSFPSEGEVAAEEFAPTQLTHTSAPPNAVNTTDLVVNPLNDHVLVAKKEGSEGARFLEFDSAGALLDSSPVEGEVLGIKSDLDHHGLAIGTGGRFYFTNSLGEVDIFGTPPAPTVTIGPVTEVGTTTATFSGTVTPPPPLSGKHFKTSFHFEYSSDGGAHWSRFPASEVEVGDGSGAGAPDTCPVNNPPSCDVEQSVTGLQPGTDYEVRLIATTGTAVNSEDSEPNPTFSTKAAAPSVSDMRAEEVGKTSAKLTGFVNPNGFATTYRFEWGHTTAYGNQLGEGSLGAGGGSTKVSAALGGLEVGAVYHFRIVAANHCNPLEPALECITNGPDQMFTTLSSFGLPDGRAPEQVSPVDKRPVGMVAHIVSDQIAYQAAADGEGVLYSLQNGLPDSTSGGNLIYRARRSPAGWLSSQMTPPTLVPPPIAGVPGSDAPGLIRYASADLSCQIVESFEPLTADTPVEDIEAGIKNLYRRNPDDTYTLLTKPVPPNEIDLSVATYHVDWASSNCSHVLFDSAYQLLPGAPVSGRILYEWANGELRTAGVRPDGSVAGNAVAGAGEALTNWNSMSADGSRVFFSAISNEGGNSGATAIFVREGGTDTVDASQSQTATPSSGGANYQMASTDGSHVFFTARYGLANNGTSAGATSCGGGGLGCDLYDYDVEADPPTLTDLSADANPADLNGASVAGVLDASNDGSRVYFAARGQLVPGEGRTEAQNLLGAGTYNVYLSDEGTLSYVGLISTADASLNSSSGSDLARGFSFWVSDATPDGAHLLFVSKANVTGYESGGVTEAYLYSADTGETVCVSCRVDGLPSAGNGNTEPITAKVQTETANAAGSVQTRPRAISDDGSRVFFKMPDALAPGAVGGVRNIYEWEKGQVYLLLGGEGGDVDFTEYADASASGSDVFVVTKSRLVPQDFDNTTDLYDLRAPHATGEAVGFPSPPPPPPPCDPLTDSCQPVTPQPAMGPPVNAPISHPGNAHTPKPKPRNPHKNKKGKKGKKHHKKTHGKRASRGRAAGAKGRVSR